ncbi:MAG: hypothetical protein LCH86_20855 [Proteobacteria bacterium]|nr:hypothetical protein [Pseudomonadota bacterium]
MSKALIVLAECVDARNGKRFFPGDEFAPAPARDQAVRLIRAGCLPDEAFSAAVSAERDAEDAKAQADADAKAQADADAKAQAEADAKAQAEADAKAQAEADAKAQAEADAKAQAEAGKKKG